MDLWRKKGHQISHDQLYGLFKRYFEGTASDYERRIVESWKVSGDRRNSRLYTEEMIERDRVHVYRQLSSRLGFAKETSEPSVAPRSGTISFTPFMRYAAASLIFLIGLSGWFYFMGKHQADKPHSKELVAAVDAQFPEKERSEIMLADGSFVRMNRGSRLYVEKDEFNKKIREVWIDGEAFFDVAKNPDKAFIIHSGAMQVLVHGTSFIVKAYHELDEYVVSVRTGLVEVISGDQSVGFLTPEKQLVYHGKSGQYEMHNIRWEDVAAWQEGKLVFSNASREELQLRIRQNFGVTINYSGKMLNGAKLNAIFPKGSSLQDILKNICELYHMSYRVNGNQVLLYKSD